MNSLRQREIVLLGGAVALAIVAGFVGYRFGEVRAEHPSAHSHQAQRRVLYWYDPMQPAQHFEKPGKSPFMDMQLIPRYADDESNGHATGIRISSAMVQNLGVRLTKVERGVLAQRIDAVGAIGFNERDLAVVQARSNGFVTRVYARAPGDIIERNAPLVDLLIPEWAGAQTEFLALLNSADPDLIDAARQRLVLLGMPEEVIAAVERSRQPQKSMTVRSPLAGVIETLAAREGMSLANGATIASINGLATVWLEAAIPEARGVDVAIGREIKTRLTAFPDESFAGRVIALLPQTNAQTRTLRLRIELPNPSARLRPGMYAQVSLEGKASQPVVYVASEALIRTGTRTVAIVADEGGRFSPVAVEAGADIDDKTVILGGLSPGQHVVASGQFLIDSEANLEGVLARLGDGDAVEGGGPSVTPESQP